MSDLDEPRGLPRLHWWIIAGVAALVVVAVVVTILGRNDGVTSPRAVGQPATDSICGLPAGENDLLEEPPPVDWKVEARAVVPVSKTAGPGASDSGVHYCFGHSTSGAVLAAVYAALDGSSQSADPVKLVQRRMSRNSAGFDAALTSAKKGAGASTTGGLDLAGYRVDALSSDRATITVAFRLTSTSATNSLIAASVPLVWESGDWLIETPDPDGLNVAALGNLNGFVEWSGV